MESWVDTCLVCGVRCTSSLEMTQHVKVAHGSDSAANHPSNNKELSDSPCCCPFCPFESIGNLETETHVHKCHRKELASPIKEVSKECNASSHPSHVCPVCGESNFPSAEDLSLHVNHHFDDHSDCASCSGGADDELLAIRLQEKENFQQSHESRKAAEDLYFKQLQEQHGMSEAYKGTGFRKQAVKNMERRVSERGLSPYTYFSNRITMLEKLEEGVDDGSTLSQGVIEELQHHFEKSKKLGIRIFLSVSTSHFGRGPGDSGWGCGYRNIQMIFSSLNTTPNFSAHMKHKTEGKIPSIPKLQEMIEKAWSEGYDARGRMQLESKLVGTRKWIGATEVFALFASLGLHVRIVDFPRFSGPGKTHPLLMKWIVDYFDSKHNSTPGKVTCENKPPLYLQHEGHSRTVVGILSDRGGGGSPSDKILVFDPGHSKYQIWKKAKKSPTKKRDFNASLFMKPVSTFNHPQYQIVCVTGIASQERIMQQKDVESLCEKVQ